MNPNKNQINLGDVVCKSITKSTCAMAASY